MVASVLEGREIPAHLSAALKKMPTAVIIQRFGEQIDTEKSEYIKRPDVA